MTKPLFEGIATALVTPFNEKGELSISMLKLLLRRQLDAGIHTIVICGTTGESPTLSDGEKLRLFKEAKAYVGNKAKILAGTGSNSTEYAVSLSMAAQDQGVDGLLVVTPYYNKCTDKGLITHFSAIAQAVGLPMILYNVPSRTGVDISVSACRELSQIPNIVGIKEASPDLRKISQIINCCGKQFSLYSGNDDLLLPILALGGRGCISVASNVCPGEMIDITDSFFAGDLKAARKSYYDLLPLMKALFSEVNPIPVKAAMACIGYDCGPCRLPLTELSDAHLQQLKDLL